MRLNVFKSKIHRCRVTEANLNYEGSVTIDADLMEAADILPHEQVQVLNVNNGKVYASGFRVDIVYNQKKQNAQFIHFFGELGPPPTVVTEAPIGDGAKSVTLPGSIVPNGPLPLRSIGALTSFS